jgi:hypothetical protein
MVFLLEITNIWQSLGTFRSRIFFLRLLKSHISNGVLVVLNVFHQCYYYD